MTTTTTIFERTAPPTPAIVPSKRQPDLFAYCKDYVNGWGFHLRLVYGVENGVCDCGNPTHRPGETNATSAGKHPINGGYAERATRDLKTLQDQCKQPNAGIGFYPSLSGHIVFDIDAQPGKDGPGNWRALVQRLGLTSDDLHTATDKRGDGFRLIYKLPTGAAYPKKDGKDLAKTDLAPGVDVLGRWLCVLPPSMHYSGERRQWANDWPIREMPTQLLAHLQGYLAEKEAPETPAESVNPFASWVRPAAAIAATPPRPVDWLTKGFIERGELVLLTAPGGSMKSLLMLDWAVCVAAGLAWLTPQNGPGGLACSQDRVLWVNTDNSETTHANRLRAVMRARGLKDCPLFSLTTTEFELAKQEHIDNLTDLAGNLGARVLVIDTLSGALTGIDENAAQQMTLPAAHLRAAADTGLTVLAIHHPPKNDENGSRGSSVLPNKADRVYAVKRDDDVLTVRANKTRNTPPAGVLTALATVETDTVTESLLSVRFWDGRAAMQDKADGDLRARILEALDGEADGLSVNSLKTKCKLSKPTIKRVLSPMLTTGEVVRRDGPRGAELYLLAES